MMTKLSFAEEKLGLGEEMTAPWDDTTRPAGPSSVLHLRLQHPSLAEDAVWTRTSLIHEFRLLPSAV